VEPRARLEADAPAGGAGPEERAESLAELCRAALGCRDCPLGTLGTRTVFGAGPADARLLLVGEAPGFFESQQGVPFVGPSGQLLNEALVQAGIPRHEIYVTNAVKHRPFVPGGRQGRNRPPKQSEVNACRQWLERELAILRPAMLVCLGAVAARAILGRDFKLTAQRGQWVDGPDGCPTLATLHPSYVMIQPAESRDRVRATFFEDLRLVGERHRQLG